MELSRYFIVEPGIWGGEPLRYFLLRTALKDFIMGVARDKIYDTNQKAGELHLCKLISLENLFIKEAENMVSTKFITGEFNFNHHFYLIRTYLFHTSSTSSFSLPKLKGYDVIKCENISDCIKKVNTTCYDFTGKKVSDLKNILTRELELKLE